MSYRYSTNFDMHLIKLILIIMPAYSIGKQKRIITEDNVNPGVGSYEPQKYKTSRIKTSPSAVIGKAPRLTTKDLIGPSPFSYNVEFGRQSCLKGYTFQTKYRENIKSESPGPAAYNSMTKVNSLNYSFMKAQRKRNFQQSPAPNAYSFHTQKHTKSNIFGKQKREIQYFQRTPGPSQYAINSQFFINTPKCTFVKEIKFKQDQDKLKQQKNIPGPGSYDIRIFKKTLRGNRFGISKRLISNVDQFFQPGPASYDPNYNPTLTRSPIATVGNSPKNKLIKNETPGPAAYNIMRDQFERKKGEERNQFKKKKVEENNNSKHLPFIKKQQKMSEFEDLGRSKSNPKERIKFFKTDLQ